MLYTIYFTYYELLEKANSFMKESSNFLGLMVVGCKGTRSFKCATSVLHLDYDGV